MYRFIVLSCLLALAQSSPRFMQKPILDGRIVGGEAITIDENPLQVSVQQSGIHSCGGSLISERYVLTAAHCAYALKASALKVRIGSSFHASGGRLVQVTKHYIHPKYNGGDYDFCILKLADWDPTGLTYGFAKLPEAGQDVADGTLLRITGWGDTEEFEESNSQLRSTIVRKANQEECIEAYKRFGEITPRMICAGLKRGGKGGCQGDSGGPLMEDDVLVGVISWGFGCGVPNFPGVHSRVTAVRDWIKSVSGI